MAGESFDSCVANGLSASLKKKKEEEKIDWETKWLGTRSEVYNFVKMSCIPSSNGYV